MENCTVFVGRLAWAIDEARLAEEFAQFGSITSTKVIRDRMTGRSKGFGYVEYATPEEAQAALSMSGKDIEGFNINVDMSQPRQTSYGNNNNNGGGGGRDYNAAPRERREYPKSEPSNTVFIGNLSFQASEQDIQDAFTSCGGINQIRLPKYHDTGKPKGYAYVEFGDIEAAKQCVDMGSATIAGRSVRLDFSQPRQERSYDNGGGNGGGGNDAAGSAAPEGF